MRYQRSRCKIVFCAYDQPGNIGGPVTWLMHLLPFLQESGFQVHCLVYYHAGNTGPLTECLQEKQIPFSGTKFQQYTEDNLKWTLGELEKLKPDVFVPNLVVPAYFSIPYCNKNGIYTLGISHSDDPFYHALQELFIDGDEAFRLDAMVAVSEELEKQLQHNNTSSKIIRIPYGVKVPNTLPAKSSGNLQVAYIGRMANEQKQICLLAKAFCEMVNSLKDVEGVLIGNGPQADEVKTILSEEDFNHKINFIGGLSPVEVPQWLGKMDVIVLLSDFEGLPIAILEAMAHGIVPVCLRMRSGITEQIEHGVNGLIVENRGEDFIEAVRFLKENPEQRVKMGQIARKLIIEKFSLDKSHESWFKFLEGLPEKANSKWGSRTEIELPPIHPDLSRADIRKPPKKKWWKRIAIRFHKMLLKIQGVKN